jgi:NAD(P) transhydrogenase subunit alpha
MEALALMIAAFAGWLLVSRAPAILHAPLISGCLFLHAIVVIAGLDVLLTAIAPAEQVAGFLTVLFGAANAAGGYAVGARSLVKFRALPRAEPVAPVAAVKPRRDRRRNSAPRRKPQPMPAATD